jgi:alpha-L-fucosidase 2
MTNHLSHRSQVAFFLSALVLSSILGQNFVRADYNPLREGFSYTYPTNYDQWPDAFVAGNGKMGIMVFGDPLHDTVIYNDRWFYMAPKVGREERTFNQVSAADLATIRDDCAAGDFADADRLAASVTGWKDGGDGDRHPGYEMTISIPEDGPVANYSRIVNFRTGEITVKWDDNRGHWERKAFVSRKDNVIVQYLTAPSKGLLNCSVQLGTDPGMHFSRDMVFTSGNDDDHLNFRAKYPDSHDAGYEGVTRIVVNGGLKTLTDNVMNISNAHSVMMLTRTAKYDDHCEDHWNEEDLQKQLGDISTSYNVLLKGQIETHTAIYDRVKLDLNASAEERAKPNEELLEEQKKSALPVPALWERLFDSGRYTYLSSSCELYPPDLLGIWDGDCRVGWGGFYHLDANLNLQIAGGNVGDMPEAMEGYFASIERWRPGFEINAKKLLGCRGMLGGGNTSGRDGLISSLSEDYPYQYATGEMGWLLYPFWEHYLITGDTAFLRNRLYPLLREMGDFYEDFLVKTDSNGKFIFAGSVSPEHQPENTKISLANNSGFDIAGAKFCLSTLIQICKMLNLDQEPGGGVERWTAILNKLPPYLINSDGALQEWSWPGLKDNYNHRHSSHMLPIWPLDEISPEGDPVLFKAASMTLEKKDQFEYEGAGHGILMAALEAANLENAESVNMHLLQLMRHDFYYKGLTSSHYGGHGVFCTDTVNTVPAIMMGMLISSNPAAMELLPALPEKLQKGAISGVKGRDRVTVESLDWDIPNRLVNCTLKSDIDQSLPLIERSGIDAIATNAKVDPSPMGATARIIELKAGVSTPISIKIGKLNQQAVLLSLSQPVKVSSVGEDENTGDKAVDGDPSTRWASAHDDNQWIYVDLGVTKKIDKVSINWESAGAKDFDIQVSDDAQSWTTVKSVDNNNQVGMLTYTDLNTQGRYVRINCKTRLTGFGFSIRELGVFGSDL